ncbi:MAG TPA: threonine ammonia-lyase, biosynthetic [Candidatus Saccharimonadia bacterium]|jgi:threonine dehydratase|nr:threonine ammonia-lyase, biosynthetic [Candidatus Saccharimonadia bacterium]
MNDAVKETLLASVYDVAINSPLEPARKLSDRLGCAVLLKREDLQPVHSFKLRGAYNKIARLSAAERAAGIITTSAGNHAQGVALSAQKLGISALIVMPQTTPTIKVEAVKSYGAKVELAGDNYSDAAEHGKRRAAETGRTYVHPFDDPLVIAGQGTIGRELLEQEPGLTHIFVPVGGGGLIAGIAQYVKALRPEVKIISVEPEDSNVLQTSLEAGKRVVLPHVGIFADGVAVKQMGELTFEICRKLVDDCLIVTTDELCAGIKSIFEETRSIVEPAGALGVAGVTKYRAAHPDEPMTAIAICSGANMTFERLQFITERTLLGSGKEAVFAVTLDEKPGTLERLCRNIIQGHNITQFGYRLHTRGSAHVFVGVTVTGPDDKATFAEKLAGQGYEFTDLSGDGTAKEHIRYMIGGRSPEAKDERLYRLAFPDRPGALDDFLRRLGTTWNISLFHYRGMGGDTGRVLIGFEASDAGALEAKIAATGCDFKPVTSAAARIFLGVETSIVTKSGAK